MLNEHDCVRNGTHRTVGGSVTKSESVVNTNDHSGRTAAVKLKSELCAENGCKLCFLIYSNTGGTASSSTVNYTEEACAISLEADEGTGGVSVTAVICMAVGVNSIVIYKNIITTENPCATCKLSSRNLNEINGLSIYVRRKGIIVLCGINNSILTALKTKGLGCLNTGSCHGIIGTIQGIGCKVGSICLNNKSSGIRYCVSTCSVVYSNLTCGGLLVELIYFEENRLIILVVNNETRFGLGHSADNNLSVVIKSDTILVGHVTLCDNNAVFNVGFYVSACVVEVVAVGRKHNTASGLCLVILGNIHNCAEFGSTISIADVMDYPLVFCVVCGGVVLTVENFLCTAIAYASLNVVYTVNVDLVLGVAKHA